MKNGLEDGVKEPTALNMVQNRILILFVLISLLYTNCNNPKSNEELIIGKWENVSNNDVRDYSLEFRNENGNILGNHCFIEGAMGDKIDCPDQKSFTGKVVNQKIIGEFNSDFETKPIKCELTLCNDTLYLKTLSDVGLSLFKSHMVFIKPPAQ